MGLSIKPKKCKNCTEKFTPQRPLQMVCSPKCAHELFKKKEIQKAVKEKRDWYAENLTLSQLKKALEKLINKIAVLIDYGNGCISCGGTNSPQGGHMHSVKANEALRFHLENIWLQDYHCNVKLSANIIKYNEGLRNLYGSDYQQYVECDLVRIYPIIQLRIEDIKEAISRAKNIVKELENNKILRSAAERKELRKKYNFFIGIYK